MNNVWFSLKPCCKLLKGAMLITHHRKELLDWTNNILKISSLWESCNKNLKCKVWPLGATTNQVYSPPTYISFNELQVCSLKSEIVASSNNCSWSPLKKKVILLCSSAKTLIESLRFTVYGKVERKSRRKNL